MPTEKTKLLKESQAKNTAGHNREGGTDLSTLFKKGQSPIASINIQQTSKSEALFDKSEYINNKIKSGLATSNDYNELSQISELFSRMNKHSEHLFCKKLQANYMYRQYQASTCPATRLEILEQAHALAVDVVITAEVKKVTAASFYKILLLTKNELALLRRSLGFAKDADALENCAARFFKKAQRLFPSYTKFPVANSQTFKSTQYE